MLGEDLAVDRYLSAGQNRFDRIAALFAEDLQQKGQQFAWFGHGVLRNPFGGRAFLGFCRLDLAIAFSIEGLLLVCFFQIIRS